MDERASKLDLSLAGGIGGSLAHGPIGRLYTQAELDAAVAAERERCARVCDARAVEYAGLTEEESASMACAERIRSLITQKR